MLWYCFDEVIGVAIKVLKNRKQFTSTLRNDLFNKLREHSDKTDIPLTKILDRAIEEYLERQDSRK